MKHYREILKLGLNPDPRKMLSQDRIAQSCHVSKTTVSQVLRRAEELGLKWPFSDDLIDAVLCHMLYPSRTEYDKSAGDASKKKMPELEKVHKELLL